MSIDTTEKKRIAARTLIGHTNNMMIALYAMTQIADEVASAGLVFQDSDFAGQPGLAHVDAAMMTNVLSNGPSLLQYLSDHYIDDVFNGVRP